MSRPRGPANLAGRMRAYEMYAAGMKKASIAREMGLTRPAIGRWAILDKWDERLNTVVDEATKAVDHSLGNEVGSVLTRLRQRLAARISELEGLCHSTNDTTKLKAILTWFQLANVKQIIPNPVNPKGARDLNLIQDLMEKEIPNTIVSVELECDPVLS